MGLTIRPASAAPTPYPYEVVGRLSNHPGASDGYLFYIDGSDAAGWTCVEVGSQRMVGPLKAATLDALATVISTWAGGIAVEVQK